MPKSIKNFISVCKNKIQSNNKRNWVDPEGTIRVSRTKSSKAHLYSNRVGIVDSEGNIVATIISSTDGKPVVNCGAKVGIITEFPVVNME